MVIGHFLIYCFGSCWCSDTYEYQESFQMDYNGDILPTTFFHLAHDKTYQMTWDKSLLKLGSGILNSRFPNKLHLKFWYKLPNNRINKEAIMHLIDPPISEQFERKGCCMPFTFPKINNIKEMLEVTDDNQGDNMWHEWNPKNGAVPMEMAIENHSGPVVLLANEDCVFLPMNKEDIRHYFDSNCQKRTRDVISRIGLNLKHFCENGCDYIQDRKLLEDEDGMIHMEIKNHERYRYLNKYPWSPQGNLVSRAYSIYCPMVVCRGNLSVQSDISFLNNYL